MTERKNLSSPLASLKKFALSSTLRLPRSRAGYTLVELLVVMAIIGILMLVSYSTMQPSRALAAQQGAGMAANAFTLARSEAYRSQYIVGTSPYASAVVVDAYADAANPNNYLRRFMVIDKISEAADGSYTGFQVNRWTWLPAGVFFYPLYSVGAAATSTVTINENTPAGAAAVSLFANSAYIYLFNNYGELPASAQFVVASGHQNPPLPSLPRFEDNTRSGFVVHLEGRISPFSTLAAIVEPVVAP